METKHSKVSVLMFPWLAYGHLSPYLELAKKLAKRNFFIYLCSTPINLISIKKNIEEISLPIELVELHLPTSPEFPPYYHTTNGLPPHLMPTLKKTFDMANENFYEILNTLKPNFLIYDFFQPWAPEIAKQLNIPAIFYMTTGAASTSFLFHVLKDPSIEFPFPEIHLRDCDGTKLTDLIDSSVDKNGFTECITECLKRSSEIILIKSFREIEGKYIDYFSELVGKDIIPVGAIVQEPNNKDEQSEIIEWLDRKDESSTVFVSFGSEYFLSEMEMKGIAHGLELSNVNFIWVVRFPGGEKVRVEEALPEGFIDRIGERGMVVEGWAPQGKILAHASIGGFVSHCGWSSLMESMKYGVPIIAIPMHVDQPLNARLVDHIAIGVEVVRDKNGRLDGEKVATVIKIVVVEKNEVVGKKVKELADDIEKKGEEEMDGVVKKLMQLYNKKESQVPIVITPQDLDANC